MIPDWLIEIKNLFEQGTTGALISLAGLLTGIYFFLRSRDVPRLAFQKISTRLVGGTDAELPSNISIYHKEDPSQSTETKINQVTKTTIVFWNDGKQTFRERDIVEDDRIRFEVDPNSKILDVNILLRTRKQNKFEALKDHHIAWFNFDYLDSQDGVLMEIYHTSNGSGKIDGYIRGLPKGLTDYGFILESVANSSSKSGNNHGHTSSPRKKTIKIKIDESHVFALLFLLGFLGSLFFGLFPDLLISLFPALGQPQKPEVILIPGRINWRYCFIAIIIGIMGFLIWRTARRKYPEKLSPKNI